LTRLILPSDQTSDRIILPSDQYVERNALVLPSHAAALYSMAPFPQAHIIHTGTLHSGPSHIMSPDMESNNAAAGHDIEQ